MADDVQFTSGANSTPPAGTIAAADDLTSGDHVGAKAGIAKLAVSANGDGTHIPATAADGLLVNLGANNDVAVTGSVSVTGGATETTLAAIDADLGAAADAEATGNGSVIAILKRIRTLAASLFVTGGGTEATAQRVTIANDSTGVLSVDDNGGSLTVDGSVSVSGAIPAGTNNIGDVDVLTVPAPLSTAGGGTEATAHRVTIANDSTGLLSVDDNGGSLTVDAPVGTPVNAQISDGTRTATVRDTGASDSLNVAITDAAGAQITSFGGGTQYAEDTAHVTGDQVTLAGVVQQAADTSLSTDGDRSLMQVDGSGFLKVNVKAGAAGATEYVEDAAAAANPQGGQLISRRRDTLTAAEVSAEGDVIAVNSTSKGELYVKQTDAVPITDNAGSITVDGSVSITGAVPAGTNNIGDVDVLTLPALPAGTNNIGDVDVLSVVPGTAATNLGKAEDAVHASGDVGVQALGVRNDAGTAFAADGDYVPLSIDASGAVRVTGGGGGTEYTEGATDATITGSAVLWEDTGNTLRPVAAATPFPVNVVSGGAGGAVTHGMATAVTAAWTTATADETALPVDVKSYSTVSISFTKTGGGTINTGNVTFEASVDEGTTWFTVPASRSELPPKIEATYALAGANRLWTADVAAYTDFQVRLDTVITVTGGPPTANIRITPIAAPADSYSQVTLVDSAGDPQTFAPDHILATSPMSMRLSNGATFMDKSEDNAHTTGDPGILVLGVRNDTAAPRTSADSDYTPLATDSAGRQGIADLGGSITVDAPVATPLNAQLSDGTRTATVRDTGASDSLNVAIVDAAGAHVTSFGGGTQYTEGDVDTTISGTAMLWEDTGNTLKPVAAGTPLPVGLTAGTANIGDVDVLTLPAIPAGTNNIGDVDVASGPTGSSALHQQGTAASDAAVVGNPLLMGGRASTAIPSAVSADGDAAAMWMNRFGSPVVTMAPHAGILSDPWTLQHEGVQFTSTQTSTVVVAGGASEKIVVTKLQIQSAGVTVFDIQVYFGTGAFARGTNRACFDGTFKPGANSAPGAILDGPFISGANGDDLMVTTSAAGTVTVNVWYYVVT